MSLCGNAVICPAGIWLSIRKFNLSHTCGLSWIFATSPITSRVQTSDDVSDEIRYRLLKCLEGQPEVSQRELADQLGISLGKLNYSLRALIDKGWVKAGNFASGTNKRKYAYLLTPTGLQGKALVTMRFLRNKQAEYEALEQKIEELCKEAELLSASHPVEENDASDQKKRSCRRCPPAGK